MDLNLINLQWVNDPKIIITAFCKVLVNMFWKKLKLIKKKKNKDKQIKSKKRFE